MYMDILFNMQKVKYIILDELFDNSKISLLIETYCMLNNIEINNFNDDSKESTYLLLLGISHKEYQEIVQTFGKDKVLAGV